MATLHVDGVPDDEDATLSVGSFGSRGHQPLLDFGPGVELHPAHFCRSRAQVHRLASLKLLPYGEQPLPKVLSSGQPPAPGYPQLSRRGEQGLHLIRPMH